MALIRSFVPTGASNIGRIHGEVECGYAIFEAAGGRYLQLDTYGSSDRALPGKVSQTLQVDESSARELNRLLMLAFPTL